MNIRVSIETTRKRRAMPSSLSACAIAGRTEWDPGGIDLDRIARRGAFECPGV